AGSALPRCAGPITEFPLAHPKASRADLIDFIDQTFGVRVSRIAVYKFLKKYGLDHIPGPAPTPVPATPLSTTPSAAAALPVSALVVGSAPPFCAGARSMQALS